MGLHIVMSTGGNYSTQEYAEKSMLKRKNRIDPSASIGTVRTGLSKGNGN